MRRYCGNILRMNVRALSSIGQRLHIKPRFPDVHSYMPELDGLRALAVLSVMLSHLSAAGFSLGWAGIELFFAISGFLITGIFVL